MATSGMNRLVHCLCRTALGGLTDRQLLEALVTRRDEAAFEVLLRRHGPMVLGVCRRVLGNAHDAEDAFQATFLVLVKKAAVVRKRDALASWLYGVASRTARKARARDARRRVKERQAAARPRPDRPEPGPDLDEELSGLPEKYRLPVVLCELEGRPRKEVARQLNIPEGTLSSRLAAGRKALAKRLRRHGWTLPHRPPVVAGVPAVLFASTVKAGAAVLAGRGAGGVVSAEVMALSEGVVKAMFLNKVKGLALALLVLGGLGVGTGRLARLAWAEGPAAREQPAAAKVEQAAAELAAAQAALKQVEAQFAAARARVAQKEAAYRDAQQAAEPRGAGGGAGVGAAALAGRFKYRIAFETGFTETQGGGRIEILDVWGTRPRIEVGGQYLVHGRYVLPGQEDGTLYFHLTASNWNNTGPDLDLQHTAVKKGAGEFTLLHAMGGPGSFHLHLVAADGEKWVTYANVYFGTGDNVWRKK
jgi:RNA polymerase sigma factor (sigma-70 family)